MLAVVIARAAPPRPRKPFTWVASVEGITEYRLPNGLRIIMVPDESVATVTVNLTVLVGARRGVTASMAAGPPARACSSGQHQVQSPPEGLGARGVQWNGT